MREIRVMLRDYREKRGVTQTFVAIKAGISAGRLSALETGNIRLSADEFLQICTQGLETTPQKFFDEEFHENESDALKNLENSL